MSDQYLGELRIFGCNFAPLGWAQCQGQLLSISQNTALFSLLGTFYGGDGRSTFALPDLRGRAPMHYGQGPGLTPRAQAEIGGQETVTLIASQMPVHGHVLSAAGTLQGTNAAGDRQTPAGGVPAMESSGATATYGSGVPDTLMRAGSVTFAGTAAAATAGGNLPHENRQPGLAMNYCIALQGVFPPRT